VPLADVTDEAYRAIVGVNLDGVCVSALCPGFVDTPLVPTEAHAFIKEMGVPIIDPSRVGEAAMQAMAAGVNGSQWIVWGDIIRQHDPPPLELT
jgi:NAD(P)-dependent dehydrogenase (short-subunit alcohol dehydrogenase family)